jgi:hypothetical protein
VRVISNLAIEIIWQKLLFVVFQSPSSVRRAITPVAVTALNPMYCPGVRKVPLGRRADRYAHQLSAIPCGLVRPFPFRVTQLSDSAIRRVGVPGGAHALGGS